VAFQWPCFANPVSVDTARSWTAEFESYDQHNEECYIVTLQEPGRTSRRIIAKVGIVCWASQWGVAEFRRKQADVRCKGKTGANSAFSRRCP
jgi:hypothetical protein